MKFFNTGLLAGARHLEIFSKYLRSFALRQLDSNVPPLSCNQETQTDCPSKESYNSEKHNSRRDDYPQRSSHPQKTSQLHANVVEYVQAQEVRDKLNSGAFFRTPYSFSIDDLSKGILKPVYLRPTPDIEYDKMHDV
jgi:hypothetical protein